MSGTSYEQDRMQSVHLSIVIILTLAALAISIEAYLMGWEMWMPPLIMTGVIVTWFVYVVRLFSERLRLYLYAGVIWSIVVFHAVQPTSAYDFAAVSLIEMVLFSQTDEKRLVRVSLELFIICFAWHVYLYLFTDRSIVTWDILTMFRILLFLASNFFVCWISLAVINQRIKDRKTEEEDIVELISMQKRSEDFLANVSHELRTPINAVLGIGSVLKQKASGEKEESNADEIFRAGRRLSAEIEDMLDYTELDTGTITLVKEPYDVSSVLNDVVTRLELRNGGFPFEIGFNVDRNVPERLIGDANIIKKLLLKAIGRALTDTKEGRVDIGISAGRRDYGINLLIEVKDTGQGLTKAGLGDARSVKYRVISERTTSTMGLGLTFPILNGLAEAMGGFCNITSEQGKGSVVRISIPQEVEKNSGYLDFRMDAVPVEESGNADAVSFDGLNVLVVDDEPMNLTVARSIFSGYGMKVQTASNGDEALKKAGDESYDVIFMDHMMPGMDGVECMHLIRELPGIDPEKTRIIALTANASSAAREMFLREGFDAFLAKPIERLELTRVLKAVLSGVSFSGKNG